MRAMVPERATFVINCVCHFVLYKSKTMLDVFVRMYELYRVMLYFY